MKPEINDVIHLIEKIPGESLAVGAIGVIVEEFSEPHEAYEAEFCDENGATIAQIVLRSHQFALIPMP